MENPRPTRRYVFLRLVSLLYRILAVIALLIGLAVTLPLIGSFLTAAPPRSAPDAAATVGIAAVVYLLGSGITAITFFAFAQLIDLFINLNTEVSEMRRHMMKQTKTLAAIYQQNKSPVPDQLMQRKGRLFEQHDLDLT